LSGNALPSKNYEACREFDSGSEVEEILALYRVAEGEDFFCRKFVV
jgi:hypothetical protein